MRYHENYVLPTGIYMLKVNNGNNRSVSIADFEKVNASWAGMYYQFNSSCSEVIYKKGVLKHFKKFTKKPLCQGLFLIKLQVWDLQVY